MQLNKDTLGYLFLSYAKILKGDKYEKENKTSRTY